MSHDDSEGSEFSYSASEALNQPQNFHHHVISGDKLSQYSTTEDDSQYSAGSFAQPPVPRLKGATVDRDSYISSISEYSGHEKNVARQVSVKRVNAPIQLINRTVSKKLDTKQGSNDKFDPDVSYNTSVDTSIPRRSSRRPKSEMIDTSHLTSEIAEFKSNTPQKFGHMKRFSLAISDDLDKLMERASSLKLKTYVFNEVPNSDSSSVDLRAPKSSSENKFTSSDSFKTASIHEENIEPPLILPKNKELPPRPSMENLAKARNVSNQIEKGNLLISTEGLGSKERLFQQLPQPPMRTSSDQDSMHSDDLLLKEDSFEAATAAVGTTISRDLPDESPPPVPRHSQELEEHSRTGSYPLHFPEELEEEEYQKELKTPDNFPQNFQYETQEYSPKGDIVKSKVVYDDENASSNYEDEPGYILQEEPIRPVDQQFKTPEGKEIPVPGVPPENQANLDNEYYDVDEPIVVTKPSRGKSVKESIKHPKKVKRKASKKKRDMSNQLKPFSYHTLINLLESINGTIIGEEFNQLNLPTKEKQLIEKIVDQLSRLTSDMVLDTQRYDIGIDRLERALKVLEGFM